MSTISALARAVTRNRIWSSIVRHGFPDSPYSQAVTAFNNFFLHVHPVKIRRSAARLSATFCLGGLSFFAFLALSVTGFLLMFYYHPSVPTAYEDMNDLEHVVSMGMFLRNVHRWSAHLMVITVFLHMLRVFYHGAYRPPREFNWVLGVFLFILTLLLSYTGYLLPWDQLAFWAITVGSNMLRAVPVAGDRLSFVLLGGNLIGPNTVLRFYVLHCVILPFLLAVVVSIHFWRVRKDGISRPL